MVAWEIIAAVGVVLAVIIAWKFLKMMFKIGIVVAAAVLLYFLLRNAGYLGVMTGGPPLQP